VIIGFVDGTVTNDQQKNKACMQQWQDKNFWQYVTGFVSSMLVSAQTTVLRHATLQLPKWAAWIINGCLVYYTKSVAMWGGINFSILMRKAKFIDIKLEAQSGKLKAFLYISLWIIIAFFCILKFHRSKKTTK
jgi:hypothetical protein